MRPRLRSHSEGGLVQCAFRGAKTQKGNLPGHSGESSCCRVLKQPGFGAGDRGVNTGLRLIERIDSVGTGQLVQDWTVDSDQGYLRSHRLPKRAGNRPERSILWRPLFFHGFLIFHFLHRRLYGLVTTDQSITTQVAVHFCHSTLLLHPSGWSGLTPLRVYIRRFLPRASGP